MKVAAFFDMDNTLLSLDSGTSYTKFLYGRGELSKRMVARVVYWSTLYKLALLDMEAVFVKLAADLRGDLEAEMIAKCEEWYRGEVAAAVAPAARVALEWHRQEGHVVVLATGSTVYAAAPVAKGVGIDHVLASGLEVGGDGRFSGKVGALCFGRHKVALAEQWARREGVELASSWFYSDSYNDLPMLERVGRPVVVNADARLSRHARRKGWPSERWG